VTSVVPTVNNIDVAMESKHGCNQAALTQYVSVSIASLLTWLTTISRNSWLTASSDSCASPCRKRAIGLRPRSITISISCAADNPCHSVSASPSQSQHLNGQRLLRLQLT